MRDVKLLACHVSGNLSKINSYKKTLLQGYSSSRGEMAPDRVMTVKSLYGQRFLMNGKLIISITLIYRYMKGLYNINRSLPKYSFTWDVGIVVKCLSGVPNNLKQGLSGKLATLLAILCGQRAWERLTVIDLRNICFEKDVVIIRTGDLLKASAQKFHLGEIKFPSYHDKTTYPLEVLKCYIDLTKEIR